MIGCAGRDGEAAESVLFFQYKNVAISTSIAKKSGLDKEIYSSALRFLFRRVNILSIQPPILLNIKYLSL